MQQSQYPIKPIYAPYMFNVVRLAYANSDRSIGTTIQHNENLEKLFIPYSVKIKEHSAHANSR